jgi:hypothetical protein
LAEEGRDLLERHIVANGKMMNKGKSKDGAGWASA